MKRRFDEQKRYFIDKSLRDCEEGTAIRRRIFGTYHMLYVDSLITLGEINLSSTNMRYLVAVDVLLVAGSITKKVFGSGKGASLILIYLSTNF